ncbi:MULTISPECIES: AAA family ATPase [Microbacterium]|uniref:AAA family ATPase n=1 Tax=Microbacterium TaxID=33882 RepID=UPI00048EEEEE|nr:MULTISPECIES: ATP-binding protein [Microbacterium]
MLVGRQAEQQAIDRLVAAARLGTSGVLAVTGEAGAGKTALLEAAVAGLGDMRVLRATGLESEHELPFGALLQLLRPALAAREGIPPVQADALAAALGLPLGDAAPSSRDRFTIGAAVLSVLCRYAEDGPLAVVVDDLQLVDTPSVDALVFAARRLAAEPIVVLCGVRIPEGDQVAAGLPALRLEGSISTPPVPSWPGRTRIRCRKSMSRSCTARRPETPSRCSSWVRRIARSWRAWRPGCRCGCPGPSPARSRVASHAWTTRPARPCSSRPCAVPICGTSPTPAGC